jgi:oligoribonuclease NrnB/cAMP/cGMP phosphodiesterase (DHH superfamily)
MTDPESSEGVLCIYHDDMDGKCSAAIVRRRYGDRVRFYAMDYGEIIPWELIAESDEVVIVDFSLPLEDMARIADQTALTWIDHHKTSMEELKDLDHLTGLRTVDEAACLLTWKTYFVDQPVPEAVMYIADRDVWRHEFEDTRPFGEGLFHEDSSPINDGLWEPLLSGSKDVVNKLIERGKVLYQGRIFRTQRLAQRKGFEVDFEGYPTLAVNVVGTGDLGEVIRGMGYDIGYCYAESKSDDRLMVFVTLYSDGVDVSEIARKFGGGGHPGAAGFSFARSGSPFPSEAIVEM